MFVREYNNINSLSLSLSLSMTGLFWATSDMMLCFEKYHNISYSPKNQTSFPSLSRYFFIYVYLRTYLIISNYHSFHLSLTHTESERERERERERLLNLNETTLSDPLVQANNISQTTKYFVYVTTTRRYSKIRRMSV